MKMPPQKYKSRTILQAQARQIIYNVYTYMKKEKMGMNETEIKSNTTQATKTSVSTLKKIIKEANRSNSVLVFRTPGKTREKNKPITGVDNFDLGVIKRCIHNFHITNKGFPTVKKLLEKLKSDISFQGSATSLRRIIKNLGFKWKAIENKRNILIEKSKIRLQRIEYLSKIKQYRLDNRPIIYTYENYVNVNVTRSNSKRSYADSTEGIKKHVPKSQRVVILHAGTETGFVLNALLVFKLDSKSSDHREDVNFENYKKWLRTQLIPNLPPRSVVVVDNTSHYNKEYDAAPTLNSRKSDMHAWLTEKRISFTPDMYKPQLYYLIKSNKHRFQKFILDKMLAEYDHDILRLPPYHPGLNPIELASSVINDYVSSQNVEWDCKRVTDLVKEKINQIGTEEWQKFYDNVKSLEQDYAQIDHIVDRMTDEFIINMGDESDSSSESDEDYEEIEEEDSGPSGSE